MTAFGRQQSRYRPPLDLPFSGALHRGLFDVRLDPRAVNARAKGGAGLGRE
jgi:hypothetical protein